MENIQNVKCIFNNGIEQHLTIGKQYRVVYVSDSGWLDVIDDNGIQESFLKKYFQIK